MTTNSTNTSKNTNFKTISSTSTYITNNNNRTENTTKLLNKNTTTNSNGNNDKIRNDKIRNNTSRIRNKNESSALALTTFVSCSSYW